jgi:hypothetical protein
MRVFCHLLSFSFPSISNVRGYGGRRRGTTKSEFIHDERASNEPRRERKGIPTLLARTTYLSIYREHKIKINKQRTELVWTEFNISKLSVAHATLQLPHLYTTRINIPYPSTPHRLRTPRILTLHNTPAARRPRAHLPRRRPVQRRHVHRRRQGAGGEFRVEAGAEEDGAAAGAFGFEVGGGEGGKEGRG